MSRWQRSFARNDCDELVIAKAVARLEGRGTCPDSAEVHSYEYGTDSASESASLCDVGDRDDMLLTKLGDLVTVLLRSCEGHLYACRLINRTMRDHL